MKEIFKWIISVSIVLALGIALFYLDTLELIPIAAGALAIIVVAGLAVLVKAILFNE